MNERFRNITNRTGVFGETRRAGFQVIDKSSLGHDSETTLLGVIACEMARRRGGTTQQHLRAARRILEASFRNVELAERTIRPGPPDHSA